MIYEKIRQNGARPSKLLCLAVFANSLKSDIQKLCLQLGLLAWSASTPPLPIHTYSLPHPPTFSLLPGTSMPLVPPCSQHLASPLLPVMGDVTPPMSRSWRNRRHVHDERAITRQEFSISAT
eukprot:1505354-Amphidinium_carterae.1